LQIINNESINKDLSKKTKFITNKYFQYEKYSKFFAEDFIDHKKDKYKENTITVI
jgi:hypothetical protein